MRASADTIAAVATAPGRAGVGIVRISGPQSARVAEGIVGGVPVERQAALRTFRDASGSALDIGIALWFAGPRSFTGEDVLELHGHGGPVVLRSVLQRCVELGARLAEPGEFTRRAFVNDRIDLAQAEAIADLIDAASEQAARGALRSLSGEFSAAIDRVASALLDLRILVEATLDFPEEDGVDFLAESDAMQRLDRVRSELAGVFRAARQGSALREGLVVVLAGAPNVGKSSLLNRLAGDDVAIVTEHPGTTRDTVRQTIVVDGLPVHLVDTAGLRHSDDPVEQLGMQRTRDALMKADLVVSVRAVGGEGQGSGEVPVPAVAARALAAIPASVARLQVVNKIDLSGEVASESEGPGGWTIRLSARTGDGLERLRAALLRVGGRSETGEGAFLARTRHLLALQAADGHLAAAAGARLPADLIAEELRLAHEALGSIVGQMTSDDLLGEIFSRFCIGK
ncbi:MAG: tRNA uridine-5-carboxymethylaminomethyl(34) synthesis GTPase MnmE [bacterium]|jgi:tRNA modification GTPase|nr:tRNA uridine-5-carboxymethylaminomethyl(34) synthesis GTPase MnmE [Betaproteobacteria bacterium]